MDELRTYVLTMFANVGEDATDLEVRAAARINEVEANLNNITPRVAELEKGVGLLEPLKKDLGVFTTIKNVVTQENLDARVAEIENQIKDLATQSNRFVEHLDKHFVQLNGLEKQSKDHVEQNFLKVENECNRIKAVIQGVHDGNGKVAEANVTTLQIQVAQVNEQMSQLRVATEAESVGYR